MEIVQKDAFKVVGITISAGWDDLWSEMPDAWEQFISRYTEIDSRIGDTFIDISLGKDENGIYTQLICTEVSTVDDVPEQMISMEIPSQKYLYFKHEGPVEQIASSFGKMYDWAQKQNITAEDFKLDFGYTPNGREQKHDLFIKVTD